MPGADVVQPWGDVFLADQAGARPRNGAARVGDGGSGAGPDHGQVCGEVGHAACADASHKRAEGRSGGGPRLGAAVWAPRTAAFDVTQLGGSIRAAGQAAAVPCSFYAWIRFQRFPAALFEGQYRGGLIQPTGAGAGSSGAPSAAAA